jgi:hypothetical protein
LSRQRQGQPGDAQAGCQSRYIDAEVGQQHSGASCEQKDASHAVCQRDDWVKTFGFFRLLCQACDVQLGGGVN